MCDPAHRKSSPPRDGLAEVNGDKVLEVLRAKGARDGNEHSLVRIALEQIRRRGPVPQPPRQGLGGGAWLEHRAICEGCIQHTYEDDQR